jgi:hypothetical protein
MTRLLAHEHVKCPCDRLEELVATYLETLRRPDGTIRLKLGLPSRTLDQVGLCFEKPVVASVAVGPDPAGLNQVLHVRWEPEGGGPFPVFSGILTAEPCEGPGHESLLALDGRYEPPGGGPGRVFDEAIGYAIARSSARALLEQLRDGAEDVYKNERRG